MTENIPTACNTEDDKLEAPTVVGRQLDKTSDAAEDAPKMPEQVVVSGKSSKKEPTPLEENDIKWRQSEVRKNDAKTDCWKVFKPCIVVVFSIISVGLVLLGIFWAYQISSIAEPIGGIKTDITDLKKYNDEEAKPRFRTLDSINTQLKTKKIILP